MDKKDSPARIRFAGITGEVKDIIGAGIVLAFSLFMIANSFFIRKTAVSKIGSGFFPRLVGILLLIIGAALMADGARRYLACRKGNTVPGKDRCDDKEFDRSVVLTPLYILAYFMLVTPLGFIIATPLYLTMQIRTLYTGKRFKKAAVLAISACFTLLVYLIFRIAFNLYLPAGIIAGIING